MEYFKCHLGQLFVCVLVFSPSFWQLIWYYENKNLSFDFITVCKAHTRTSHQITWRKRHKIRASRTCTHTHTHSPNPATHCWHLAWYMYDCTKKKAATTAGWFCVFNKRRISPTNINADNILKACTFKGLRLEAPRYQDTKHKHKNHHIFFFFYFFYFFFFFVADEGAKH